MFLIHGNTARKLIFGSRLCVEVHAAKETHTFKDNLITQAAIHKVQC